MSSIITRKIAAAGAAAVLAAGGLGAAVYTHAAASPSQQTTVTTSTTDGKPAGPHRANALKTVLDQLVSQGKINSTQETEITAALQQYAQTHHPAGRPRVPFFGAELQAIAKALNLTPAQLRQDLQKGMSIDAIATQQKVNVSDVHAAAYNATKAQLDLAVKDGKITQARETQILSTLNSRLQTLFAKTPGQFSGSHQGHGFRGGPPMTWPAAPSSTTQS